MATITKGRKEDEFVNSGFYKVVTSKRWSYLLAALCVLTGLFAVLDYWGPKHVSMETIKGFPNGGNYFLIRTDKSYFPIDERLQYQTTEMHEALILVNKSMTGVPLSFTLPQLAPGTEFYPVSTRYSYISLQVICLLFGLLLFFYPKWDDTRMYLFVGGIIALLCGIIPMIGMELTIDSIYSQHTIGW